MQVEGERSLVGGHTLAHCVRLRSGTQLRPRALRSADQLQITQPCAVCRPPCKQLPWLGSHGGSAEQQQVGCRAEKVPICGDSGESKNFPDKGIVVVTKGQTNTVLWMMGREQ